MSSVGDTLRVLVLLLEHPDGGRLVVGLSSPRDHHGEQCRARFEMDPSDLCWRVETDLLAEQAFRSASRESDGYVVQREYIFDVPHQEPPASDWKQWLLDRLFQQLGIDPVRWVQGQPAEGDTRLGPDGRRQRYTRGRWTETPLGVL